VRKENIAIIGPKEQTIANKINIILYIMGGHRHPLAKKHKNLLGGEYPIIATFNKNISKYLI